MSNPEGRRLGDRIPVNIRAEVVDDRGFVTPVDIKDISASGARLEIEWGAVLPPNFILRYGADRQQTKVELVWRKGYDCAVRFIPDEPDVVARKPSPAPAATKISVADLRRLVSR